MADITQRVLRDSSNVSIGLSTETNRTEGSYNYTTANTEIKASEETGANAGDDFTGINLCITVQPSTDCYILFKDGTAASTLGLKLAADAIYTTLGPVSEINVIASSDSGRLQITEWTGE